MHYLRSLRAQSAITLLTIIGLYIALLAILYHGLLNSTNIIFPDLGAFPIYPKYSMDGYLFTWNPTGFGENAHTLVSYFLVAYMAEFFHHPGIAAKLWMFSLLPLGSISVFFLARSFGSKGVFVPGAMSFAYSFNPITSGLIYFGSVNDTLTMYSFLPLLILLCISVHGDSIKRDALLSTTLAMVAAYVFYWDPAILIWFCPFFFVYFCGIVIMGGKAISRQKVLTAIVITISLFLVLTDSFSTLLTFLLGNGNTAFVYSSNGSTGVHDLLINFTANFKGQLSVLYWYLFAFLLISLVIFSKSLFPKRLTFRQISIHYAIVIESISILGVWLVFVSGATGYTYVIARYIPVLAAYEPFLGGTLLFSLLFFDFLFFLSVFQIRLLPSFLSMKWKSNGFPSSKMAQRVLSIVFVVLMLILSVNFWQSPTPSAVDMIHSSNYIQSKYSVPNDLVSLADWLHLHSPQEEGSRALFVPQGMYTESALSSYVPWLSFPNLSTSFWPALYRLSSFNLTEGFASSLAISGVSIIIVYNGTFVNADRGPSLTGPVRFGQAGFPWQLSYVPEGSWQNWTALLGNSSYFETIAKLNYATVFRNILYNGTLYCYPVGNGSALSTAFYSSTSTDLYFANSSNMLTTSWLGIGTYPWKYNWTQTTSNGSEELKGGSLPVNMSYTNLWQKVSIHPRAYMDLKFSVYGTLVNEGGLYLRYYSGSNMTGIIVNTQGFGIFSGNTTRFVNRSFLFETPSNFSSAAVFVGYSRNNAQNNESFIEFANISLRTVAAVTPIKLNYSFVNPTDAYVQLNGIGTYLVVFAANFDPGWKFGNATSKLSSMKFYNGFFDQNAFVVENPKGEYSLHFSPQVSYAISLKVQLYEWITSSTLLISIAMTLSRRVTSLFRLAYRYGLEARHRTLSLFQKKMQRYGFKDEK